MEAFVRDGEKAAILQIANTVRFMTATGVSCYEAIAHFIIAALIAKQFGNIPAYNEAINSCRSLCSYAEDHVIFDEGICRSDFQVAIDKFTDAIISDTRIFTTESIRRIPFVLYIDTIVKQEMEKMILSPSHFFVQC